MDPAPLPQRFAHWFRARVETDRWGIFVCSIFLFFALWLYAGSAPAHRPGSDGFYSWIYARSLAFDGDIHFSNDYALCGDPFRIGVDRGAGRPDNMFYFGPALVWTPLLWILKFVFRGYPAHASCGQPFSTIVLGLSPLFGAMTAWLCYRLARRQFSDGISALSVALLVLGGPLLEFSSVLPSYSHVYDALATCALLELTLRAKESPHETRRWFWVALALGACILQRLSNVMFAAIPVIACATLGQTRRRLAMSLGMIAAGVLLGLGIQGAIYQYLYGSPFVFSHGPYFLHLNHAHPFLLLFDKEEGLFHFAPAVWISVIGAFSAYRDKPTLFLLIPWGVVALCEIYLSSAALDWSSARRLTNLAPLWVLLACYPLRSLAQWFEEPARSRAAAAMLFAAPFAILAIGYSWGAAHGKIPLGRPLSQAELQGGSTTSFLMMMEEKTGSLPVLPAEIVFAARYRLPRDRFGDAAYQSWYARDYRTLQWFRRNLPVSDPIFTRLADGFAIHAGEARPLGPRSRLVSAMRWPFATHFKVRASAAKEGQTLRVGFGRTIGEPAWCGDAKPLPLVMGEIEFSIPQGVFSSGIQEIVFEWSGDDVQGVVVSSLSLDDRVPRPLPFARGR